MTMRPHTIRDGESLIGLGARYGFDPQTVWNDGANRGLHRDGRSPSLLAPGDVVQIPGEEPKKEDCVTEQRHRFRASIPRTTIELRFLTGGQPRADESYRLRIDDEEFPPGRLDGDGRLSVPIPADAHLAEVRLGPAGELHLFRIGRLDPIGEIRGVQQRLNNLGFHAGVEDGEMNESTRAALRSFQSSVDLDATGEADDRTRQRLTEAHE